MTASYTPTRSTAKAWIVCLAASLFFFYEFVQMMMFNAINPSLMVAFSVTATDVGKISSAYFIANIIFMFPAGIMLDRFSTRKIIISAMILCIAGTLLFSLSTNIYFAMFCRFLTGVGGSFPFLCCLRLASRWFPARRWALVSGVMVTMAFLGGAAGQTPMTFLVNLVDWRHALQIDALLGCLFTFLIFLNVQDCPPDYKAAVIEKAKTVSVWRAIKASFGNIQNWFYGLYTSMLNLSVMLLGAIYGGLYLVQVRGLTNTHASVVTSMIFFGTIFGSPTLGWLSDKIGLRKLPMIVCAVFSLAVLLVIVYAEHLTYGALLGLFFALGFITSGQIISYPAISESNSHEMAGSALGFASVLIMIAPAFFQPFFGWLMDLHWDHKMQGKIPLYSLSDFHNAMLILPVTCLVGLILAFFAKETFCRSTVGRQHGGD